MLRLRFFAIFTIIIMKGELKMVTILLFILLLLLIGALLLGATILLTGFAWLIIPVGIDILVMALIIKAIKKKK